MSQAFVASTATAPRFPFLGHDFAELASGAATGGAICVHEIVQRAGEEPPLHIHRREDEVFYVLEGQMTFHVGDRTLEAPGGTLVFLPRGVPHGFRVHDDEARVLQICAPGGVDVFFAGWGDRALDVPAMSAALEEFGVEIVGPPPGH
ncbi:MAG: cupin domain-containing protein [Thermoleophilia bacterium]